MTNPEIMKGRDEMEIRISADKENNTIIIECVHMSRTHTPQHLCGQHGPQLASNALQHNHCHMHASTPGAGAAGVVTRVVCFPTLTQLASVPKPLCSCDAPALNQARLAAPPLVSLMHTHPRGAHHNLHCPPPRIH